MAYLVEILKYIVFGITILSAVITILLGWKRFKNDFLLKKVTLPVYTYIIILFIIFLLVVLKDIFFPIIENRPKPLRKIENEKFGVQRICIDGIRFEDCEFDRTELLYTGEAEVNLLHCNFYDPRFVLDGSAERTIKFLTDMYKNPTFRPGVDLLFKDIKKGRLPASTPPSNLLME